MDIIYSIVILLFGLLIFYFYWLKKETPKQKNNFFQEDNYDFEVSNQLALTVKNSDTAYAHWDLNKLSSKHKKLVFKLYDITAENKAKLSFIISPKQKELFIKLPDAKHLYYAKLGFYNQNNNFIPLAVSEAIDPPTKNFSEQSSGVWLELKENKKVYSYEDYNYLSNDDLSHAPSSKNFNSQ